MYNLFLPSVGPHVRYWPWNSISQPAPPDTLVTVGDCVGAAVVGDPVGESVGDCVGTPVVGLFVGLLVGGVG
jgi:hypothetical protein